jgi:ABC-type bacteriocin/lantibiotic exporter with double-glycine peptidase domain
MIYKFLQNVLRFTKGFKVYLGPKVYLVILVSTIGGLLEAAGISFLIPLIESLLKTGGEAEQASVVGISALDNIFNNLTTTQIILLILIIFGVKAAVMIGLLVYVSFARAELLKTLRTKILTKILSSGPRTEIETTGSHLALLHEHVTRTLQSFHFINRVYLNLIQALLYFGIAIYLSWHFALFAFVIGAIIAASILILSNKTQALSSKISKQNSDSTSLNSEVIRSRIYLKATGASVLLFERASSAIGALAETQKKIWVLSGITQALKEPIAIVALIILFSIELMIFNQPVGSILLTAVLFHRFANSLLALLHDYQYFSEYSESFTLVDTFIKKGNKKSLVRNVAFSKIVPAKFERIRIKNLSVEGKDGNKLLNKVSMDINQGELVGLIGGSGAGKTTLIEVLLGVHEPTEGLIEVCTGKLRKPLGLFKHTVGYVSQDAVIYQGTIFENIHLWSGVERSKEARLKAELLIRKVGLEMLLENGGIDSKIDEDGGNISGGQKQRLFLARELFKEPDILILDEATSALDESSEKIITSLISSLRGLVTIVSISHNPNSLINADKIIELKNGRISNSYTEMK